MCKKFHQAQIFISASVLKIYFPVDYCAQTESFYLSHIQIKTFYIKKNKKIDLKYEKTHKRHFQAGIECYYYNFFCPFFLLKINT